MAQLVEHPRRQGLRRMRWRLRGAWLWPAFVVVTALEMLLLHWLPIAGAGPNLVAALLLAGCLNVIAIAALGKLGGAALRRLRPDLPKVVAEDYAGLAALAVVGGLFVAAGLVHRPELVAERQAFARQVLAVRLWIDAHGGDFERAHVGSADAVLVDDDLFRTCVPAPEPKGWLCLIVDTSQDPAHVRRDQSRESNATQNPRAVVFR